MDRRQRKSRQAIFRAFTELLKKESYPKITVQEIIDMRMWAGQPSTLILRPRMPFLNPSVLRYSNMSFQMSCTRKRPMTFQANMTQKPESHISCIILRNILNTCRASYPATVTRFLWDTSNSGFLSSLQNPYGRRKRSRMIICSITW